MSPRVRYGVIVGGIGLIINVCVAGFVGICGPFVGMIAGGVAGYLTIRATPPTPNQKDSAREAAFSGAVAGALVAVGQLIGGVAALAYIQSAGLELPFGQVPTSGDSAEAIGYWVGGIGIGICFGLISIGLGAAAGAAAGYFGTPSNNASTV